MNLKLHTLPIYNHFFDCMANQKLFILVRHALKDPGGHLT
jgi:hypothetical protein